MYRKMLLVSGALVAGVLSAFAADPTAPTPAPAAPSPAPAAPAPLSPAETAFATQLQDLVTKVKGKIQAGSRTEEALAPELKEFNALIDAHRTEKTETTAKAAVMRAMLYVQVFEDYDKGAELLKDIQTNFPNTQGAQIAAQILPRLDAQKETMKVQAALKTGAQFPDFNEKDLAGAPLSIAKFKGKVVLVDFWATWCGPCVAELPNVIAAYEKYHAKGFEVVGISLDQDEAKLKAFIAEKKMTWPQYFDGKGWESKLGRQYGVNSIPATYLLDGDGKIIAKDLRGPALDAKLEELLAKK